MRATLAGKFAVFAHLCAKGVRTRRHHPVGMVLPPRGYDTPMRPTHCSKCNYDLAGLPGAGNCPECGQRYWITRGVGIGKGETATTRGSRLLRRIRTILIAGAAVLVVAVGFIVQLTLKTKNAISTGLGVGGLLMICAVLSYALEKDDD
jgi:hypothetical protein